jgi:hypothetical protein
MRQFKFFHKEDGDIRFPPLLHNEQLIHYWNDGDYENTLTARIIAWSNEEHRRSPEWTFTRFIGTMEEFFMSIQTIPVIKYIEREGSLLYMGEDYPIVGNLGGIYEIYYYEYNERV